METTTEISGPSFKVNDSVMVNFRLLVTNISTQIVVHWANSH